MLFRSCEGSAERAIMTLLLEHDKLKFNELDLFHGELIKERKAAEFEKKYLRSEIKDKELVIIRILDSKNEKFKLSKAYIDKFKIYNIYTHPEIERLVIINEKKDKEYLKVKTKIKASEFCKSNLKMKDIKKYNFIENYFTDIDNLIRVIKLYHKISPAPDHYDLSDLLK